MVGVVTSNVTAAEYLIQLLCHLLESRLVFHVLILDTCQVLDELGNHLLRVDEMVAAFFPSVREDFNIGYLNDTVLD